MSFSFEFTAERENARQIIEEEVAPEVVKEFIRRALLAFQPDSLVYVKAHGHLFNNDYQRSNADIVVEQRVMRVPKKPSND